MSIIPNVIIYYIHSIIFFSILLVGLNYCSLDENFIITKLYIKEWKLHQARKTTTSAKVTYNNKVAILSFDGDLIKESKQIDSLIVEINSGILGYGYVKSFKLDMN